MSPVVQMIDKARLDGVRLSLSLSGSIKARGKKETLQRWLPDLREHKVGIVQALSDEATEFKHRVREFMELDGLSLEAAQELAAVSVPARPTSEWLAMIAELDQLVEEYCELTGLDEKARAEVMEARLKQPLATIPESHAWFRVEIDRMRVARNGS